MKLQVGKKYRNRRGTVVEISSKIPENSYLYAEGYRYLAGSNYVNSYMENGKFSNMGYESFRDLIEEVIDSYNPWDEYL